MIQEGFRSARHVQPWSLRALAARQTENLLQCGTDVECGTLKTTMQQISKLVRRQDGIKKRESQIPSDYYVDSFKKKREKGHILFPSQLPQYRKINIVVRCKDEDFFASNKSNWILGTEHLRPRGTGPNMWSAKAKLGGRQRKATNTPKATACDPVSVASV